MPAYWQVVWQIIELAHKGFDYNNKNLEAEKMATNLLKWSKGVLEPDSLCC